MWTINLRLGFPELALAASLTFLAGLIVLFIVQWPVGLVPAASYGLAIVGAYLAYRLHERERARAVLRAPEESAVKQIVRFRVVDTRGACPLGRRRGDVITISPTAHPLPAVCPMAEAVLRSAAADTPDVDHWCCPIYDHLLVFRREPAAA